jgi:hypothetical protein
VTHTYRLTHPQLSEPIEIDSHVERTERGLAAWATMWCLRQYDVVVTLADWTVEELDVA